MPGLVSGASSLSGESGFKEKDAEPAVQVPSILRTGETVKARHSCPSRPAEDDECRYSFSLKPLSPERDEAPDTTDGMLG
jgi:hypothetical protein